MILVTDNQLRHVEKKNDYNLLRIKRLIKCNAICDSHVTQSL